MKFLIICIFELIHDATHILIGRCVSYVLEWSHGLESWSGAFEWIIGVKCWSERETLILVVKFVSDAIAKHETDVLPI